MLAKPEQKNILAIDAALGPCSIALLRGGTRCAWAEEVRPKEQARQLVLMVEGVLKEAGVSYAEIDCIVCTVGPGTFTGLRIGLAAARGIGFTLGRPVHGVTTLACVALASGASPVVAVLNAGKGEVYAQAFTRSPAFSPLNEPLLTTREAALRTAPPGCAIAEVLPGAEQAGLIAALHPHLLQPAEPFYIRAPDAKLPA